MTIDLLAVERDVKVWFLGMVATAKEGVLARYLTRILCLSLLRWVRSMLKV